MAEKRLRKVSARIADDGSSVEYAIFGPASEDGKQPVADTTAFHADQLPQDRFNWFALYGLSQVVANAYNRPSVGDTPTEVLAVVNAVLADVASGEWSPGRQSFAERDPTDLELALAEVMGQSVDDVMKHVDEDLQTNDDGSPKLDKRGRTMRVFTKRMLDDLADDPAVKPVYARIVAERAKRLSAEAKAGKSGVSKLGGLFAPAQSSEPAAAEAVAAQ
jgi:hypothetical protein